MTPGRNHYRHPHPGTFGKLIERLANSRRVAKWRSAVMSRLPFLTLESDVTDVVYLSWLVDADVAQAHVPEGVRLWQRNGKTPFTVLTYRHGNFGPSLLGPLRRLFPSPLQSNWRFYVDPADDAEKCTVFFLKNVLSDPAYTLVTRVFSDVLQAHLPSRFVHERSGDTIHHTEISTGAGSSPSLKYQSLAGEARILPPAFAPIFADWDEAVEFLAHQDAALAFVDRTQSLAISDIDLPIALGDVLPATVVGPVTCSMAETLRCNDAPFGFLVPKVKFRVLSERLL